MAQNVCLRFLCMTIVWDLFTRELKCGVVFAQQSSGGTGQFPSLPKPKTTTDIIKLAKLPWCTVFTNLFREQRVFNLKSEISLKNILVRRFLRLPINVKYHYF